MLLVALLLTALVAQQQTPVPKPFPQPGTQPQRPAQPAPAQPAPPPPAARPPAPALPPPRAEAPPSDTTLGVTIYPGSQFLASYDAGRGQRYYLFGSTASFIELVTYYRTLLKQRGDQVFEVPATHMFEIGRFREETMAFPPSVTIKDYQSEVSQGYPNPKPGAKPERFPTVIQVVPAPASER